MWGLTSPCFNVPAVGLVWDASQRSRRWTTPWINACGYDAPVRVQGHAAARLMLTVVDIYVCPASLAARDAVARDEPAVGDGAGGHRLEEHSVDAALSVRAQDDWRKWLCCGLGERVGLTRHQQQNFKTSAQIRKVSLNLISVSRCTLAVRTARTRGERVGGVFTAGRDRGRVYVVQRSVGSSSNTRDPRQALWWLCASASRGGSTPREVSAVDERARTRIVGRVERTVGGTALSQHL